MRLSLAGVSRRVRSHTLATDTLQQPADYAAELGTIARQERIDILLPMTDPSVEAVLEHRAALPETVVIPFRDLATYRASADKAHVLELARSSGFDIPETRIIASADECDDALSDSTFFPAVIKPHRSVVTVGGARRKIAVTPVPDSAAARRGLSALPVAAFPVLLQRWVEGIGEGFFALRWGGRTVAMFAHRRLREKPPAGGVSVYRESIPLDERLVGPGLRLLEALGWNGVAMIECKRELATGRQVVMEVNGRFWGSLQLAIDAGVDFPSLLVRCAAGEIVPEGRHYRVGVRSRWFLGDVDHLYLRLRRSRADLQLEDGAGSRLRALLDFLRVDPRHDRCEVWRWRDPAPFLVEGLQWLGLLPAHRGASPATSVGDGEPDAAASSSRAARDVS